MAVTQLTNLNALRYIKEDFELMAKIVSKLPIDDQKRYDEYVTWRLASNWVIARHATNPLTIIPGNFHSDKGTGRLQGLTVAHSLSPKHLENEESWLNE